jgi:hypothetical protein
MLDFFDKNDTGDSSLIDPGGQAQRIRVQAVRLDAVPEFQNFVGRIRLLKLEAEGAEPEILAGAGTVLSKIDYIAVDMGPERGAKAENTVVPVCNHLMQAGFELIRFNHMRCLGLFRSRAVSAD